MGIRYRILLFVALMGVVVNANADRPKFEHYQSDGLDLVYMTKGEGEPMLLIHGSGVNGNLNWRVPGTYDMLAEDYRVVMPDVRGHGRSESPDDKQYGEDVVRDIVALLDHLNIESAHVVGYSMGGMITMKMAAMFPERMRSATVGGMGWLKAGSDDATGYTDHEGDGRHDDSIRDFGEFATTEEEIQAMVDAMPVRVIVGTEDDVQVSRVKKWLEIEPQLEVVYIEGANHGNCIQRDEFKQAIKSFIDSVEKSEEKAGS